MMRPIETPVTVETPDGVHDSKTTHPAFAQISANRITGHTNLYDSEFNHSGFIAVRIRRSELHRGLHRDSHYATDELIEVNLSESQWATFVSKMNHGDGTPCTIDSINNKWVPGLPDPVPEKDKYVFEVEKTLAGVTEQLEALREKVGSVGLSGKKQAELQSYVHQCLMACGSSMDFAVSSFAEHVEATVEKAKQEVHGYVNGHIHRAGLAALGALPISMPTVRDDK